jgi:hypothetical protein
MKVRPTTTRSPWSAGVLAALLLSVASSALASTPVATNQGNYRGQCRRLSVQIKHFEGTILPMAIERGNRGWADATNAQIERLWHRRADLCPKYDAERTMMRKAADRMRKFNRLVATAARAAASYFTGGIAGGIP